MEAPDVTGSSLTLGAAGSRRTVYLIDENQKIPETADGSSGGGGGDGSGSNSSSTATLSGKNNTAEPQTPTSPQKSENPATFLMYNRINNIIGGNSTNLSGNEASLPPTLTGTSRDVEDHQDENKLLRNKRPEDKNNSIWYEYGCV